MVSGWWLLVVFVPCVSLCVVPLYVVYCGCRSHQGRVVFVHLFALAPRSKTEVGGFGGESAAEAGLAEEIMAKRSRGSKRFFR